MLVQYVTAALGACILLVSFLSVRSNESWTEFGIGVVVAMLIVGGGWVSGMVIMAQGQIIQAVVDTTVNTSPLLHNPSKAQFLSAKSDDPLRTGRRSRPLLREIQGANTEY